MSENWNDNADVKKAFDSLVTRTFNHAGSSASDSQVNRTKNAQTNGRVFPDWKFCCLLAC
jgi:hypothetical protein